MIRHFGIFPDGFDKDNLFTEQKQFLMYLVGGIPSLDSWKINIEYQVKLAGIKATTKTSLTDEEISLATLHGTSLDEMKRNRLIQDKLRRIKELNEQYGVKTNDEDIVSVIEEDKDNSEKSANLRDPQALWNILQGKGIVDGNA